MLEDLIWRQPDKQTFAKQEDLIWRQPDMETFARLEDLILRQPDIETFARLEDLIWRLVLEQRATRGLSSRVTVGQWHSISIQQVV
jgi:hypothetical protein